MTTVETATYGSEFVAGRTAVEQVIDIRMYLRYLGVPVKGKTRVFGDNELMVKSSTLPHSTLSKRHNALSYHRVREAISSDMMSLHHITGDINPADILSKHWGYQQVWPQLRAILFTPDTSLLDHDDRTGGDKIPVQHGEDKDEDRSEDTDPKLDTTNDSDMQSHFRNLSGTQREPEDIISATKNRKHKPGNLSRESQQPSHLNAETHRRCVNRSNGVT